MGNTVMEWRASIGCWAGGPLCHRKKLCCCIKTVGKQSSSSPWFKLLVLAILLMIGGVELNPGPVLEEYTKRKGVANMAGEFYELKLSALLFLRAVKNGQEFKISSNMEAARSFDDIVVKIGENLVFLQLKHKGNANTVIRMPQLSGHKDFNLSKYFKSYLDIKENWDLEPDLNQLGKFENSKFVIYTNIKVDECLVENADSNKLINLIRTSDKCFNLSSWANRFLHEVIRSTPDLHNVVCSLCKKESFSLITEAEINDLVEGFLSQLWFCPEQASEEQLDEMIRQEIFVACGTDIFFSRFITDVQTWWRNSNIYLTDKADIWQDIVKSCAISITNQTLCLNIRFSDHECHGLRKEILSHGKILLLQTDCIKITSLKVLQSLETKLAVDVGTFQMRTSEVLAIWRLGTWGEVLVVEGRVDLSIIAHEISDILQSYEQKRLVIVNDLPGNIDTGTELKLPIFNDIFSMDQLNLVSQNRILSTEVIFQGYPVSLKLLASESELKSAITANVIVQLLTENQNFQMGCKVDSVDSCYIPRTFAREEILSEGIFTEKQICLAITGISLEELKKIVPLGTLIQNFDSKSKHDTCRYFIITGINDFNTLCKLRENVHWIHRCDEGFLWKKSKGNIQSIKEYLTQSVIYTNVQEVTKNSHKMIVLIGEPGMGKTTEMSYIAQTLKQIDRSMWIVRVDLNEHVTSLRQNSIHIEDFLCTAGKFDTFQNTLFKYQLHCGGNITLLFDAFDEISPIYSDKVFNILRDLSDSQIKNIFVTSRPVMKRRLEQNVSSLSFSFVPFSKNDQKNFFTKFWEISLENSYDLSDFISELMELTERSLSKREKEFTGIPLQTRMLAEVFWAEALEYCKSGRIMLPPKLDLLQLYNRFLDKKWEIYYKKMNFDEENAISLHFCQDQRQMFEQQLMYCAVATFIDDHYIKYLRSNKIILKKNQEFVNKFKTGQEKSGIVIDIINNKCLFIHQTFVEFYVAMWFSEAFDIEIEFIKKIYLQENCQVVCNFFDRLLTRELDLHVAVLNEDKVLVETLLHKQNISVNDRDEGGRTALHFAVMNFFNRKEFDHIALNNARSIMCSLLEYEADPTCKDEILCWRPLRLADAIEAWSAVELLLQKQIDKTDLVFLRQNIAEQTSSESLINAVSEASKEGYLKLLQIILDLGFNIERCISNTREDRMLHVAAECGNLKSVEFLVERGASVEALTKEKKTPLMLAVESSSLDTVEYLIKCGACVNSQDALYETALVKAIVTLLLKQDREVKLQIINVLLKSGANVHVYDRFSIPLSNKIIGWNDLELLTILIEHGASVNTHVNDEKTARKLPVKKKSCLDLEMFNPSGSFDISVNRSPLTLAVQFCNVEATELLIKYGASVNYRDKGGKTPLSVAVKNSDRKMMELLLQNGASEWEKNKIPLISAIEYCNKQAAECLLKYGASVNEVSEYGRSPLFVATYKGNCEMIEFLLQNGAHVDLCDMCMTTPLMKAVKNCNMEAVKLLIEHGASVNTKDQHGKTALFIAVDIGSNNMVELLLDNGADVELRDINQNTPLMIAIKHASWNIKITKLLIEHGVSVNAQDQHGESVLSLSVKENSIELLKVLLDNGADIETSDKIKRTPLMKAIKCHSALKAELLIKYGASVNTQDIYGKSALFMAIEEGDNKTIELLNKLKNWEHHSGE